MVRMPIDYFSLDRLQRKIARQKSRLSESEQPADKTKEIKKKPATAQEVQESVEVGKVSDI